MSEITYQDIKDDSNNIFIDVRSPKEFNEATIPGAINIPIFDNEERELIGTLYKKNSVDEAKKNGVDIAAKKLPSIYAQVSKLNQDHQQIYMFCSRGGFRSSSIAPLFHALDMKVTKLRGGYKEYRAFIREELARVSKDLKFIVLYGNTGTGKTHILEHLRDQGMNVLDLEACANHRGSILGSVGLGEANTQKMFESLLYEELKDIDSNLVFVEGESKRIGKVLIPPYIFDRMNQGISLKITAPMEKRVKIIIQDYVKGTDDQLIEALNHMRNRLGNENIDTYIELVKDQNYPPIIKELFTNYYDPLYRKHTRQYISTFENLDSKDTANNIIQWIQSQNIKSLYN